MYENIKFHFFSFYYSKWMSKRERERERERESRRWMNLHTDTEVTIWFFSKVSPPFFFVLYFSVIGTGEFQGIKSSQFLLANLLSRVSYKDTSRLLYFGKSGTKPEPKVMRRLVALMPTMQPRGISYNVYDLGNSCSCCYTTHATYASC